MLARASTVSEGEGKSLARTVTVYPSSWRRTAAVRPITPALKGVLVGGIVRVGDGNLPYYYDVLLVWHCDEASDAMEEAALEEAAGQLEKYEYRVNQP